MFLWVRLCVLDGFATSLTPRKRTKRERVATGDRMEAGVALPNRWEVLPRVSAPLLVRLNSYRRCRRMPTHRTKPKSKHQHAFLPHKFYAF